MKKTIQINIAGIIFNIEEDAFDTLSAYLKAIQTYFASYESHEEIVSDIEARIAEKFMGDNKAENAPIITIDEVDKVIKSMGTVADFAAIEEEEDLINESENIKDTKAQGIPQPTPNPKPKSKMYRDTRRKALGGVLAGLAHNLGMDVTWVRIIFLILFFGTSSISFGAVHGNGPGIAGILLIAYIVCWIVFPANNSLEEDPGIKKFYRNPEGNVIGGVCTGLSAYFGIDISVVRLLFVLGLFFFGIGFITYLILWITAPEAKSITQKMEMKGEAVTLENIKTNITQNLDPKPIKPESGLSTILLFPFRALGTILSAVGKLLSHLGPLVRILLGILLLFIGLGLGLAAITGTGVLFGAASSNEFFHFDKLFGRIMQDIPQYTGLFFFLFAAMPAIGVILSGITLIGNKKLGTRNFWLTGLALWLLGFVGLATIGGKYSANYARKNTVKDVQNMTSTGGTLYLDINQNEDDDDYNFELDIDLENSGSKELFIEKQFSSNGYSRENARENAEKLSYKVIQNDSLIIFDAEPTLEENVPFRNQKVKVIVKIPENQNFRMSRQFARSLLHAWDLGYKYGISDDDYDKLTFRINRDNDLECIDCPKLSDEEREALQNNYNNDSDFYGMEDDNFRENNSNVRTFEIRDFQKIKVGGTFDVKVKQGTEYKLEVAARNERDLNDLDIEKSGDALSIAFENRFFKDREKVVVYITMPNIEGLDISGASKIQVYRFKNMDDLDVEISGASKAAIDIEANNLTINDSGASKLSIRGEVKNLDIDISGASKIEAENLNITHAKVNASGASDVNLGKVESLDSNTNGAAKVTRR